MVLSHLFPPEVEFVLLLLLLMLELLLLELEVRPVGRRRRDRPSLLERYVNLFGRMEHLIGLLSGELRDGLLRLLEDDRPRRGRHDVHLLLRLLLLDALPGRLRLRLLSELLLLQMLRPVLRRRVLFVFLFGHLEAAARVVTVAVPQSGVRPCVHLVLVHRPVQEVVDEMVLRRLLTDVLRARWHTDQVHLENRQWFKIYRGPDHGWRLLIFPPV